jgi:hypothetical protein
MSQCLKGTKPYLRFRQRDSPNLGYYSPVFLLKRCMGLTAASESGVAVVSVFETKEEIKTLDEWALNSQCLSYPLKVAHKPFAESPR